MDINAFLASLRGLTDPLEQARAGQALITEGPAIRNEGIGAAIARGISQTAIAAELGITKQAVSRIIGPERAWWATQDGELTVAAGGKLVPAASIGVPPCTTVSMEATATARLIEATLAAGGMTVTHEVIPPGGSIDLNRSNLVVVAGPATSPFLAQVLASDPHIAFEDTDTGWTLRDKVTSSVYTSPMASGVSADYGYLGRLPRPDGNGTFGYMAGINAPGNLAAAHYLVGNLAEVWKETRGQRFSCITRCEFMPGTCVVTKTERVTKFYLKP